MEGLRLQRTVERSDAHVAHSRSRFQAGLGRLAAGKKIKVGARRRSRALGQGRRRR